MAIFRTFHHKLGNVWPLEYIADNGEVFYLRRRIKDQLIFIVAGTLNNTEEETFNATAVIEYLATVQTDADGNEFCTIECASMPLCLRANEFHLGDSTLTWQERRRKIDDIKGIEKL